MAVYETDERAAQGSFVTFPNQQIITSLQNENPEEQRVFVTVAVQPGGAQSGSLVPFNTQSYAQQYPSVVPIRSPPNSQQQSQQPPQSRSDNYSWGPTHPINRASPATVKWLLDNFEQADGVSLPRARMYDHYIFHSQQHTQEPVNAASFGKLVRSVFTGLKTRRLGTRGNSKYHYYGIRIKDNSPLHEIQRDPNFDQMVDKMAPKPTKERNSSKRKDRSNDDQQSRDDFSRKRHLEYIGDTTTVLPEFPTTNPSSLLLPGGIDEEDIELFEEAYRNHCEEIVDTVVNLQFDDLQQLWFRWWQLTSDELEGRSLAKEKMLLIFSVNKISDWIHQCDSLLYKNLADLLIPDVLRQDLPQSFLSHIREFAKQADSWMRQAIVNTPESIQNAKIQSIVKFSSSLRQLTTLNHLANEFRKTFQQNDTIWPILLRDMEKIDFVKIQDQISWITNCPLENIQRIADGLKGLLQSRANVEEWMTFLQDALYHSLDSKSSSNYTEKASEVILKWNYYSSMVMRDFTLRSSPQFGSLVILRMFLDELVTHIIINRLQKPHFDLKPIDIKTDASEYDSNLEDPNSNPSSSTYITLTTSTHHSHVTSHSSGGHIQFADQSTAVPYASHISFSRP